MITVKGLRKHFGELKVLNGIDQHISPGEKVVIIGPSGSGKSTFLRCLNLLEVPTDGQIFFEGTEITAPKTDIDAIRCRMGMASTGQRHCQQAPLRGAVLHITFSARTRSTQRPAMIQLMPAMTSA